MRNALRSAVSLFLALTSLSAFSQCMSNCPDKRTISITATDSVFADADLAIVHVGYRLFGQDAKEAYATASQTSNAILQALTGSGVLRDAIESSSQVLARTQPYELQQLPMDSERRLQRQFTVIQGWTVRVKPDDAAKTLNTAITAGANESGWIEWKVENPNTYEAQASAKALADAQATAEQAAKRLNVHLGPLFSASESQDKWAGIGAYAGTAGMHGILGGIGMGNGMPSQVDPLAITSRRIEFKVTMQAVFLLE